MKIELWILRTDSDNDGEGSGGGDIDEWAKGSMSGVSKQKGRSKSIAAGGKKGGRGS